MSMLGRMLGFGRNEHYDKGIRLFDQGMYEETVAELALACHANGGRLGSIRHADTGGSRHLRG